MIISVEFLPIKIFTYFLKKLSKSTTNYENLNLFEEEILKLARLVVRVLFFIFSFPLLSRGNFPIYHF